MGDKMISGHLSSQTAALQPEGNRLFPVFLKLENLSLLIVGGGHVGLEKLKLVLKNSPKVNIRLVAIHICEEIKYLVAHNHTIELIERAYHSTDIDDVDIVIAAVKDVSLSSQVSQDADEKGKLINTADRPELCDFYLSSIVHKGDVKIAISTNGKSPIVARHLNEVIDELLPDGMENALDEIHIGRESNVGGFGSDKQRLSELIGGPAKKETTSGEIAAGSIITDVATARRAQKRWRRVATYCVGVFGLMLIGHFIFSYVIPLGYISNQAVDFYLTLDKNFHWMILAGFIAQMVDGALGMGYGVTSSAILLSTGINPAAISGSIHTAEMFASGASGYSHYKFGNVNKKLFKALVIPGVIGAVGGAILLVFLGEKYSNYIRPILATYTLFLGFKIFFNAFRKLNRKEKFRQFGPLAGLGGFLDSFGGGGWGPIVTTTLITKGRSPRFVIGTVSLTEFFVTLASAFTFFTLLGVSHWQTIIALILGGFIAAPLAAKLTGKLPRKTSFILLGILVIIWSLKILSKLL